MFSYVRSLDNVYSYLNKYARNDDIKNAAWKEFIFWINRNKPELLKRLSTNGIKDLSPYMVEIQEATRISILNVKRLVFKNEILELIGKGNWSKSGDVWWGNHSVIHISGGWIVNPQSNNRNTKIEFDNRRFKSKYSNFNIDWNGDKNQRTDAKAVNDGHWEYYPKGIVFNSGDEDNIKYILNDNNRTWFAVVNIPSHDKYWSYNADPRSYRPNSDSQKWFNENDLRLHS